VSVTFTSPDDNFNAIGLSDFAPAGWTVAANNSWNTPPSDTNNVTANRADYIWNGPFNKGTAFTAVYQVTVPTNATPGVYSFSGGFWNIILVQPGQLQPTSPVIPRYRW